MKKLGCLIGDSSLPRWPLQVGGVCDPLGSIPSRNQFCVSPSPALSGGARTPDFLLPHLPGGRPVSDKQQELHVAVPGGSHDPGKSDSDRDTQPSGPLGQHQWCSGRSRVPFPPHEDLANVLKASGTG